MKTGLDEEGHGGESMGVAGLGGLWMELRRSESIKGVLSAGGVVFFACLSLHGIIGACF